MLLAPFGPVKKGSVIKTTYNNTKLDLGSPRLGPYAIYYLPDWQPPQNYTQRFFSLGTLVYELYKSNLAYRRKTQH